MNKNSFSALALSALVSSCGGKVETDNHNHIPNDAQIQSDASTEQDANALKDVANEKVEEDSHIAPIQYLTRGQLAQELKSEIMGFPDDGKPCVATSTDIPANTELCRSVNWLKERDIMTGYKDHNGNDISSFGTDDTVTNEQVWKIVSKGLQWTPYAAPCISNNPTIEPTRWSYDFAGALCDKGIDLNFDSNPSTHATPESETSLTQWEKLKSEIADYYSLNPDLTRAQIAELVGHSILNLTPEGPIDCNPVFSDVGKNSLTCFYTNELHNAGFLSLPGDATYRPDDNLNNAELSKLLVETCGNDNTLECTGCSKNDCSNWYTAYVDALCEKGLVDATLIPEDNANRKQASKIAWRLSWGE